jgi:hypothetical protein
LPVSSRSSCSWPASASRASLLSAACPLSAFRLRRTLPLSRRAASSPPLVACVVRRRTKQVAAAVRPCLRGALTRRLLSLPPAPPHVCSFPLNPSALFRSIRSRYDQASDYIWGGPDDPTWVRLVVQAARALVHGASSSALSSATVAECRRCLELCAPDAVQDEWTFLTVIELLAYFNVARPPLEVRLHMPSRLRVCCAPSIPPPPRLRFLSALRPLARARFCPSAVCPAFTTARRAHAPF